MKKERTGTRYVKADNPDLVKYFTDESIRRYDPVRAGWVKDEATDYPAPQDVVNFMNREDKAPAEEKAPEEVKAIDYTTLSIKRLEGRLADIPVADLERIIETDERVSARRLAEREIQKRKS